MTVLGVNRKDSGYWLGAMPKPGSYHLDGPQTVLHQGSNLAVHVALPGHSQAATRQHLVRCSDEAEQIGATDKRHVLQLCDQGQLVGVNHLIGIAALRQKDAQIGPVGNGKINGIIGVGVLK